MDRSILVLCTDLIFSTKITSTARSLKIEPYVCLAAKQVPGRMRDDTTLVLIDLASCSDVDGAAIRELRAAVRRDVPLVAFGSHVEVERLREAREAGCDVVLTRSVFTERLVDLLSGNLLTSGGPSPQ